MALRALPRPCPGAQRTQPSVPSGPLEKAPASPVPWPAARQPTAVCTRPWGHAREERSRGHPRPQGSAYLYPLVRGPKIQNKTMLDETRERRPNGEAPPSPGGTQGASAGDHTQGGFLTPSRSLGPGEGRAGKWGYHAQAGALRGQSVGTLGAGPGGWEPALTELLQLRGHGLGAQGEGRGRSSLWRRRSWEGAGGRDGVESLAPCRPRSSFQKGQEGPDLLGWLRWALPRGRELAVVTGSAGSSHTRLQPPKGVHLACSWLPSAGLTPAPCPPAVTTLGEALGPLPSPGPGRELLQWPMQVFGAGAPGPRLSAEHSRA